MSTHTPETMRIRGHVRSLQGIAATYGEPLSDEFNRVSAVVAEASRLTRVGHAPAVTPPADPSEVAAYVKKLAAQRTAAREAAIVAQEVADAAEIASFRLGLAEVPRVLSLVADAFATATAEFTPLAARGSIEITANTSSEEFAAHRRQLALVDAMNMALGFRVRLAEVLGEELTGEARLWLVLDLQPSASSDEVRRKLNQHRDALPSQLEDWLDLARLGLSIAAPGDAQERANRFGSAVFAAGLATPDGGMAERTYGEALEFVRESA